MGTLIKHLNNVRLTSTTRGTGVLQLSASAAPGYQHPNEALAQTGDRGGWIIQSQNRLVWELVEGVLTQGSPWTLSRVRYVAGTGPAGQPINWQAEHGVLTITATTIADRLPALDTDGRLLRGVMPTAEGNPGNPGWRRDPVPFENGQQWIEQWSLDVLTVQLDNGGNGQIIWTFPVAFAQACRTALAETMALETVIALGRAQIFRTSTTQMGVNILGGAPNNVVALTLRAGGV